MANPLSDMAAERGILCGITKYGRQAYYDIVDLISSNDFVDETNQGMFTCIRHILDSDPGANLDFHLVLSAAAELGLTHVFENDRDYLKRIFNFSVELSNLRAFAKKVKKFSIVRDAIRVYDDGRSSLKGITGEESIGQIISMIESPVIEYVNSLSENNGELTQMAEGIDEYIQNLIDNPCEAVGIPSGYPRLDHAHGGGFRRGTVQVFAARAKMGKTTLARNIALHVAGKLKIPVLFVDTEMQKEQHFASLLAYMSSIAINDIETSKFVKMDKVDRILNVKERLKKIPLTYQNVQGKSFEEVLAVMRRWIMQHVGYRDDGRTNDCLIVYDYLKLMDDADIKAGNIAEHQAIGFRLMELNALVVKYDVPCLTFAQLNRAGLEVEDENALASSDRITQYAATVCLYKRKSPEEIIEDGEQNGDRRINTIVTRFGSGVDKGDYIYYKHMGHIAKIEEVGSKNELKQGKGIQLENPDAELQP